MSYTTGWDMTNQTRCPGRQNLRQPPYQSIRNAQKSPEPPKALSTRHYMDAKLKAPDKNALHALEAGDIDTAIDVIKSVEHESDLLAIKRALLNSVRRASLVHVEYSLGLIEWRLGEFREARQHYLSAADAGMFSDYCAISRIVRDVEPESSLAVEFLNKAASYGHIWSQLEVLKNASSGGELTDVFWYYSFRFLVAPVKILVFNSFQRGRERVRY